MLDGCRFKNSVTFNITLPPDIQRVVTVQDVPAKITYAPNDEEIFVGETVKVKTRPAIRSGSFSFDRISIIGTDVIVVNDLSEILIEGVLYELCIEGISYPYAFNKKTLDYNEYFVYPTGVANFFDIDVLNYGDVIKESLTIDRATDDLYKTMFVQTYLADELTELYEPSELIVHRVSSLLENNTLNFPECVNPYVPRYEPDHLNAMVHNIMEWRSCIEDIDLEVSISLAELMGDDRGGSGRSVITTRKSGKKVSHNLDVLNMRHYQLLFELASYRGTFNLRNNDPISNQGIIVDAIVAVYAACEKEVTLFVKNDSSIVIEYTNDVGELGRDVVLVPLLLLTLPMFS